MPPSRGFPTSSLPKHGGKPDYSDIKYIHQLMTANAASGEINLRGGYKGYFEIILPPNQYARIANTPFVCLPNQIRTERVP